MNNLSFYLLITLILLIILFLNNFFSMYKKFNVEKIYLMTVDLILLQK